jgi:hypothetical protein
MVGISKEIQKSVREVLSSGCRILVERLQQLGITWGGVHRWGSLFVLRSLAPSRRGEHPNETTQPYRPADRPVDLDFDALLRF